MRTLHICHLGVRREDERDNKDDEKVVDGLLMLMVGLFLFCHRFLLPQFVKSSSSSSRDDGRAPLLSFSSSSSLFLLLSCPPSSSSFLPVNQPMCSPSSG